MSISSYHQINITNSTGFKEILTMPNTITNGWFWSGINLMIFFIAFITIAMGFGWEAGLLVASFLGMIVSLFLLYLGLASLWMVGIYLGFILLMIIYIMWNNKYD